MTHTRHTPSPWEDNGNGLIYGQCSGDDGEAPFVADVCHVPTDYTDQEKANGRLITAAPDLLAACRMVVTRWDRGDLAEAARACQAAVELATGGSPPWDITDAVPATRISKAAMPLLTALKAILPYAENEHASLFECWKRDGEATAEAEAEACGHAIDLATTAIAAAEAVGIPLASAAINPTARFEIDSDLSESTEA